MRFKLNLKIENQGKAEIPFSYLYECSAVIYKILSRSDKAFAAWLHDNGFAADNKKFKLFTFSFLDIPKYKKYGDKIEILSDHMDWQISFLPERSTQEFVQGLFKEQQLEIGTRQASVRCRVQNVSMLPEPNFNEKMIFRTISPVCIQLKRDDESFEYISPDHHQAEKILRSNALDKYKAFYGNDYTKTNFPFHMHLLSKPVSKLITVKAGTTEETKIRGYLFKFILYAPIDLMKIIYHAGLGGKNSLGFGIVEEVNN